MDSSSTEAAEAEIDTAEMGTTRTGNQSDTMNRGEWTGVTAEAMVIQPTSHNPNMDSGADITPTATELGRF